MTVSATNHYDPFIPNGIVLAFPFTFRCDNAVWVSVLIDNVAVGGYTVALNADQLTNPGGTVTFAVAPTGLLLIVMRTTPLTQETAYDPYGRFPADSHEAALDKLTLAVQDFAEIAGRTAQYPIGSDPALQVQEWPLYEANLVWAWHPTEVGVVINIPNPAPASAASAAAAAASAAAALVSENAAAASEVAAAASAASAAATAAAVAQIGRIVQSFSNPDVTRFLECNGSSVSQATYASLFAAVGHRAMQMPNQSVSAFASAAIGTMAGKSDSAVVRHTATLIGHTSNGTTWGSTVVTACDVVAANASFLYGIGYGAGSNRFLYSADGITWNDVAASGITATLIGMAAGATLLLCYPTSGTTYWTSADGLTWTARTIPVAFNSTSYTGIQCVNDVFYYGQMTSSGTGELRVYRSTDGINWSFVTFSDEIYRNSHALPQMAGDGTLMLMQIGDTLYKSTDNGLNWVFVSAGLGAAFNLMWTGKVFISHSGLELVLSVDGNDWITTFSGTISKTALMGELLVASAVTGDGNGAFATNAVSHSTDNPTSTHFCVPKISEDAVKRYIQYAL